MQTPDIDSAWDFSAPAASEERFRAMLSERGGMAPGWHLEVRTQLARVLGLQQEAGAPQGQA